MLSIEIIADPKDSSEAKGKFFEQVMRQVFETQRYEVIQNLRFTGSEIDLLAKHKDKNETIYIECKARQKENLSSTDVKNKGG